MKTAVTGTTAEAVGHGMSRLGQAPVVLDGEEAVDFFTGAKFLVSSQDRYQLLQATTGLSDDEILERVRVRVTTLDQDGVEIAGHDIERVRVPFPRARE